MEQQFSVEEIVNDRNIHNPEKVRMLYLYHNKTYAEISDLLGLKESTVKCTVSKGGYCKALKGSPKKYGDLKDTIAQMCSENPDITAHDIANEVGCSASIVRRYINELGLKVKRSHNTRASLSNTKDLISGTKEEDINAKDKITDTAEDIQENIPVGTSEIQPAEDLSESKLKPEIPENKDIVTEGTPVSNGSCDEIIKPYELMDWPYVVYKGRVYEVLEGRKLRDALRRTLIIKPKKRKGRKKTTTV